jgi:hypothetical protein
MIEELHQVFTKHRKIQFISQAIITVSIPIILLLVNRVASLKITSLALVGFFVGGILNIAFLILYAQTKSKTDAQKLYEKYYIKKPLLRWAWVFGLGLIERETLKTKPRESGDWVFLQEHHEKHSPEEKHFLETS